MRHAVSLLELDIWGGLITAVAFVFVFLFLLRCREALRKGASPDPQQFARMHMVFMAVSGEEVRGAAVQEADGVVFTQGATKADLNGQESVSNVYSAPGESFRSVRLLKKVHLMRPEHFFWGKNFLFTLSDGSVLRRGRWATGFWRVYVWEGRGHERNLASRMLSSSFPLLASLADFKRLDAS